MARSRVTVLLTKALIAWCFRLEAHTKQGSLRQGLTLDVASSNQTTSYKGKRRSLDLADAGVSSSSGSSASLEPQLYSSVELDLSKATFGSRLSDRPMARARLSFCSPDANALNANSSSFVHDATQPRAVELNAPSFVQGWEVEDAQDVAPGDRLTPHLDAVRKQVEYYLSDENLRHDTFFRDKISGDPDGWLDIALILGCYRMRRIGATLEDVLSAVRDSKLELKNGSALIRRPGNAALPKLEPRPQHQTTVHEHVGGLEPRSGPVFGGTQRLSNLGTFRSIGKEVIHLGGDDHPRPDGFDMSSNKAGRVDSSSVLERVNAVLHDKVAIACQTVRPVDTAWDREDFVNRIVRYIFNSAKRTELRSMDFVAACDELVEVAMQTYEISCSEKAWFFELDLAPAFASAAWELLRGQRGVSFEQVEAKAREAFERYLDFVMLNKAMWEASSNTFPDVNVHSKVYAAVRRTYRSALEAAVSEVSPLCDLLRVQVFFKHWIDDSMSRAWASVPDSQMVLTRNNVVRLFHNLLYPYGPYDPFCTIPAELIQRIGLPPWRWEFIGSGVEAVFRSWAHQPSGQRRRGGRKRL